MKILALDISSATIGWSVFLKKNDKTIKLIAVGHIKPLPKKKAKNLSERISGVYDSIMQLLEQYQPDVFAVEDYARKFSAGRSTANTIILLSVFNETARLAAWRYGCHDIESYPVSTARKTIKEFYNRSLKSKEDVIAFAKDKFQYTPHLNRIKNIAKECEDEADSIIIGVCCAHKKPGIPE